MGRRGPMPKPTAVKRAQGNPGRRKLNDDEPVPPAGEVAAPKWLPKGARAVWSELAPVAAAMQTLTTADVEAFAHHCSNIAMLRECRAYVEKNGAEVEIKGPDGAVKSIQEHPKSYRIRSLAKLVMQGDDRFGLNPAARSRIRVERPATAAPVAAPATAKSTFADKFRNPIPISRGVG